MKDVIDAEFQVVGEPEPAPFRIPWVFCAYTLIMWGGCIGIAATNPDPWVRGSAVVGAATFLPLMKLFGFVTQKVSEREAQRLRQDLLHRPATLWGRAR